MTQNLPIDFQIKIHSEEEFITVWAGLQALGYDISRYPREHVYQGRDTVIKHSANHRYIWSSCMRDYSKTQYSSFEHFQQCNPSLFKPSMKDAVSAVELDKEIGLLQSELDNSKAQVARQERVIAEKLQTLKKLQDKLGIKG